MPGQSLELLKISGGGQFRFMRMNADARVHEVMLLGEPNAAVERTGAIAVANGQNVFDSAIFRAGDHLLAIRVKLLAFEMGVGIDEHRELNFVDRLWMNPTTRRHKLGAEPSCS